MGYIVFDQTPVVGFVCRRDSPLADDCFTSVHRFRGFVFRRAGDTTQVTTNFRHQRPGEQSLHHQSPFLVRLRADRLLAAGISPNARTSSVGKVRSWARTSPSSAISVLSVTVMTGPFRTGNWTLREVRALWRTIGRSAVRIYRLECPAKVVCLASDGEFSKLFQPGSVAGRTGRTCVCAESLPSRSDHTDRRN